MTSDIQSTMSERRLTSPIADFHRYPFKCSASQQEQMIQQPLSHRHTKALQKVSFIHSLYPKSNFHFLQGDHICSVARKVGVSSSERSPAFALPSLPSSVPLATIFKRCTPLSSLTPPVHPGPPHHHAAVPAAAAAQQLSRGQLSPGLQAAARHRSRLRAGVSTALPVAPRSCLRACHQQ